MTGLDLATIDRLTNGRLGTHDIPCPLCGPFKSPGGQRRDVLRIWRVEPGFAGYHCARCGEHGYVRDRYAPEPDRVRLAKAQAEATERDRVHKADRLAKARWLWSQRQPIGGTIAERYLREARGITCPLPATLGFLAPRKPEHHPAMISAFALPDEIKPGLLGEPRGVEAVHLTLLRPDGSGKADVDKP